MAFCSLIKNSQKMLLLALLLAPVVLADLQEKTINNYVIKIDGHTLKSIEPTGTPSDVLNLSGLGLQDLDKDVFRNLTLVKNLDLGNNSLSFFPYGLFSTLVNLEHLSLADNSITVLESNFEGLNHLKTLNISNNPMKTLGATDFFGLKKSSVIFTKALPISTINAYVFEKDPGPSEMSNLNTYEENDEETTVTNMENPTNQPQKREINSKKTDGLQKRSRKNNWYVKVCIDDGVLKLVTLFKENGTLPAGCQKDEMEENRRFLDLGHKGITKFEKGWYQLDKLITGISFQGNKIVEVTSNLLNDLPASVDGINLSWNKIERLNSGIINNRYVTSLQLFCNKISEIEAGTFANMPKLRELVLLENLLNDTKFAAGLPRSVYRMHLEKNRITEISPGSFSNLEWLTDLYLSGNLIQEVKSNSLHGLSSLQTLDLSSNRISSIEPGAFHRTRLYTLLLVNNSISGFGEGTIDNTFIYFLDLSYNKLTSIKKNFPGGLPPYLHMLNLDFNEIKELERDNFKDIPLFHLSLTGNKISKIERGAFDLQTSSWRDESFFRVSLDKNSLNELNSNSFRGLKYLKKLSLVDNGITSIPKGFTRNMLNLDVLDLSNNPIKRLQNGALYGFRKTKRNVLVLNEVPVEVIEGGLFDDL